jgi:hypothetical protein
MKITLKLVFGVLVGLSFASISFATESDSSGQTGETQSSCGAKSDAKTKNLVVYDENESAPQKPGKTGKSTAGSAEQ